MFPVLALGTLMATLDLSIVNIALPTLSRDFAVALTTIEWVVLAYVLTITGLLLACGRLADGVGRRRVYGAGLIVFTAASALCAAAGSPALLVAARALQGVGAALMTANSTALLAAAFAEEERGKALGLFGAIVGVGLGLGPPLGGLMVEHWSWRWIFLLNVPLGVLAVSLLGRIPADVRREHAPRLPWASTALWCAGLTLLMLALSRGPATGWRPSIVLPLAGGACTAFLGFAALERRAADPLLPVTTLRGPFGNAATLTLIGNMITIAVGIHLPLYLEEVRGFDVARSGRWVAVLPLVALLVAPSAGRLADRQGSRPWVTAGFALIAAGLLALGGLGATAWGTLVAGMVLVGLGQGLFSVPNARAILGSVREERLGLASGMQATMRNLGFSAGAALSGALLETRFRAHGGLTLAGQLTAGDRLAFVGATADTYKALTGLALAGAALAFWGGRRNRPGTRTT